LNKSRASRGGWEGPSREQNGRAQCPLQIPKIASSSGPQQQQILGLKREEGLLRVEHELKKG